MFIFLHRCACTCVSAMCADDYNVFIERYGRCAIAQSFHNPVWNNYISDCMAHPVSLCSPSHSHCASVSVFVARMFCVPNTTFHFYFVFSKCVRVSIFFVLLSFVITPKLFCCCSGAPLSIRHWCHRYSNKPFVFRLVPCVSFIHSFGRWSIQTMQQSFWSVFCLPLPLLPLLIRINSVFIWYSVVVHWHWILFCDSELCVPTLFSLFTGLSLFHSLSLSWLHFIHIMHDTS